jgi:hypothetical protein
MVGHQRVCTSRSPLFCYRFSTVFFVFFNIKD